MTISPIYSYIIQHIAVPCNAGHDNGEMYNKITQFKADYSSIIIAWLNTRWMAPACHPAGNAVYFFYIGAGICARVAAPEKRGNGQDGAIGGNAGSLPTEPGRRYNLWE